MTPGQPSHRRLSDVTRAYRVQALCSGVSAITFAQRLADAYHAGTDVHDRVIEFHVGTTADGQIRAMKLNAKTVERLASGDIRFPLDLVDAWAEALGARLGLEFRRELARGLGFLGAEPPTRAGPASDIGTLVADFGETMRALAPLLADGRIDADDCPTLIRTALREGADLMAAWATVQARLQAAMPQGSVPA